MKKISLLTIAQYLCRISIVIAFVLLLGLTVGFIVWNISPQTFQKVEFNIPKLSDASIAIQKYHYTSVKEIDKNGIVKYKNIQNENEIKHIFNINDMDKPFVYLLFLQISISFLLVIGSIKEFLKIITLSKNRNTFSVRNIQAFRRIGLYCLTYTIVSSPTLLKGQNIYFWSINLNITLLIIMIIAFIIADVFKEGNKLSEENKYTI